MRVADTVLKLPEALTLATASAALRALEPALVAGAHHEADASALRDFDSSALALLLQLRRSAQAGGGDLAVRHAPAALAELAALYGVDATLPGLSAALPPAVAVAASAGGINQHHAAPA